MAQAQRQEEARQTTIASDASLPLFSALHAACTSQIGEQKAQLNKSRDLIQNFDASVRSPSLLDNRVKHERCFDGVVKAWRAATETYTEIFSAMVKVTAGDAKCNRLPMEGHDNFKTMLENARAGRLLSAQYTLAKEGEKDQQVPSPKDFKAAPNVDDVFNNASERQTNHESRSKTDDRAEMKLPSRKRPLHERGDSTSMSEALLKRPRKAALMGRHGIEHRSTTAPEPVVEFEDISAEVEARLKAKDEQKRAKKHKREDERKRKRESDGSNLAVEEKAPPNGTPVERPRKKKPERTDGAIADISGYEQMPKSDFDAEKGANISPSTKPLSKKEKRKKSLESVPDVGEAEDFHSKKRKMANT